MQANGYQVIPYLPEWGSEVQWSRKWQTGIESLIGGGEVRNQVAKNPLLSLSYTIVLADTQSSARAEADIRQALLTGLAAVPYFGRGILHLQTATGLTVPYQPTPYNPQNGDWLLFGDGDSFECAQVASAAAGVITLQTSLTGQYGAGTLFWPLLFGKLTASNADAITPLNAEWELDFSETSPNSLSGVGGIAGSSTGSIPTIGGLFVFNLETTWGSNRVRQMAYDLREVQIGFGTQSYAPTNVYTSRVFEADLTAGDAPSIAAIDNFLVNVNGRAQSFYFPDSVIAFEIVAAIDATHFKVKKQNTEVTPSGWDYCMFSSTVDGSQKYAQITAVADNGDGTETVTCVPVTTGNFDPNWVGYRLHKVRLADDVEKATFIGESLQTRTVRLASPPDLVVVSSTPVWLYYFETQSPSPQVWRFTSYEGGITAGGFTWTEENINHTTIRRSIKGTEEDFSLKMFLRYQGPLWYFLPEPPDWRLLIKIYETDQSGSTPVLRFTGEVRDPRFDDKEVTAKLASFLSDLDRKIPGHNLQPRCNYNLGEANTCKFNLAGAAVPGGVLTISAPSDITFSPTSFSTGFADYFTYGKIEAGTGASYEIRSIIKSSFIGGGVWSFTLSHPFRFVAVPGGAATAYPGCDRRLATCASAKFNNKANFGGFPWIPINSLTIKATSGAGTGGKK